MTVFQRPVSGGCGPSRCLPIKRGAIIRRRVALRRIRIGELLVEHGLVTTDDVATALESQKASPAPLGTVFVRLGMISESDLLEMLSELLDIPVWDLESCPPTEEALACVPQSVWMQHKAVPVHVLGDELLVAMSNVDDVEASDAFAQISKKVVKPALVRQAQIEAFLGAHRHEEAVEDLVSRALEVVTCNVTELPDETDLTVEATAPVVSLVNQIITEAIALRASDVHIEPRLDRVDVRFRLDGLMQDIKSFPSKLHRMVVARIKIMAELDIVETRLPQDGHFTARLDGRQADIRISVLPNLHGARVVLRIMDGSNAVRSFDDLGLSATNLSNWHGLLENPYGLILVTGPTGSGKTTTLYTALGALATTERNVMTCEDPVECDLERINQSQVNDKIGLTFARQLRAILRQDPDVILVGEIRDSETLQTAIRASMTGHLVLSTLHCNDAVGALPRLFDMGAEPFLLSTSLLGVLAQRLVRKLCPQCRYEVPLSSEEAEMFHRNSGSAPDTVWVADGCPACAQVGFKGRTGVHELFVLNPETASLIARRATIEEITAAVAKQGMVSIQQDALEKVSAGVTSVAEAKRLVAFTAGKKEPKVLQAA